MLTTNPKRVNPASMTQKQRRRCEAGSLGGSAKTEVRNIIITKKRCRVQERRSPRFAWPWHRWHGLPGKLQFRSYNTGSRLENLELRHRAQRESERASSVDRSYQQQPCCCSKRGERQQERHRGLQKQKCHQTPGTGLLPPSSVI